MKGTFVKTKELVELLKDGWEIYTRRGSAPYSPLYFHISKEHFDSKRVHPLTIKSCIEKGIITGTEVQHQKYKLRHTLQ